MIQNLDFLGTCDCPHFWKIVHEWYGRLEIISRSQVIENSRQYLLLRTDVLKKTVGGWPEFCLTNSNTQFTGNIFGWPSTWKVVFQKKKMNWPIVMYCIFRIAAVFTTEEIFRSVYTVSWQNKRLSGKAVKNIDSPSLMSCSQLCLRHSWCTSTNFKESFGKSSESNCELNKHDFNAINDETKLMDQPGTAFTTFLKVRSYKKRYNNCNSLSWVTCTSEKQFEDLVWPRQIVKESFVNLEALVIFVYLWLICSAKTVVSSWRQEHSIQVPPGYSNFEAM